MISLGCKIGYWQGNVNLLVDDIGALKPSVFIGVPRVFDRIYSRVIDQVGWGLRVCCAALWVTALSCGAESGRSVRGAQL